MDSMVALCVVIVFCMVMASKRIPPSYPTWISPVCMIIALIAFIVECYWIFFYKSYTM